jgi:hypothetical protein
MQTMAGDMNRMDTNMATMASDMHRMQGNIAMINDAVGALSRDVGG